VYSLPSEENSTLYFPVLRPAKNRSFDIVTGLSSSTTAELPLSKRQNDWGELVLPSAQKATAAYSAVMMRTAVRSFREKRRCPASGSSRDAVFSRGQAMSA
jgi:hypothetical protein